MDSPRAAAVTQQETNPADHTGSKASQSDFSCPVVSLDSSLHCQEHPTNNSQMLVNNNNNFSPNDLPITAPFRKPSETNLFLSGPPEFLEDGYFPPSKSRSKLPSLTSAGGIEFERRDKIVPFSPFPFYHKKSDSSNASPPFLHRLSSPTSISQSRKAFRGNNESKNVWTTGSKNEWMEVKKTHHHLYQHPQIMQQRLVFKNGECNVTRANIKKRRQRYMADIFTTLVDIKWRWNLLNFVLAFTLSWLIFALAWWLICFSHGDFDSYGTEGHKPCVEEVYDFATALLFSIETQQTIGFGSRRTNPHCPEAILLMMCQSCFGVIIQALMTGLVFAKLSRPKKRAETLLFSKNALVCKRDGQLCLLFRVGDMRKSHIVEAHVKAIMIKRRVTEEGEVIPLYQYDLMLGDGETEGRLFMVWPVIVEHRIDEDSPFWELSAEDLRREQFELVVVLEGIVESTGMTTQARTSYLPSEILWGHRFEKLVTFQKESGQYFIDYSRFHSTVAVEIPQCSAKEMQSQATTGSSEDSDDDDDDDDGEEDDNATASVKSDSAVHLDSHHQFAGNPAGHLPKIQTGALADLILATSSSPSFQNGDRHKDDDQDRSVPDETVGLLPSLLHVNRADLSKRYSAPSLRRKNGINSVALAAFDLQNEEHQQNRVCPEDVSCDNSIVEPSTFRLVWRVELCHRFYVRRDDKTFILVHIKSSFDANSL